MYGTYDYMEIGPVPAAEECQQVGMPGYDPIAAKQECQRFIDLIRQVVGEEPEGARLVVKSNPHDFGTYYEVAVKYDVNDEIAVEYAMKVESEAPLTW